MHHTHHTYECLDCGRRISAAKRPGGCPDCGGEMRNLGVPLQQ